MVDYDSSVVQNLKERNVDNMNIIASEYYGSNFSYSDTFKMFDQFKNGFISLAGKNRNPITIVAPTTVASLNAFYGAMNANKIVNLTSPGFISTYTKEYTTDLGSDTVVIFDSFLNSDLIEKFHSAGVKNVIITSISDYMEPSVVKYCKKNGVIPEDDFLDHITKCGINLPSDMNFIRMSEFAKFSSEAEDLDGIPFNKDQIGAYFLTGATTSRHPKGVKLFSSGFNNMIDIYDHAWFDFKPGDRQTLFIPLYYATGAVHGTFAGLFSGMTLCYRPKYDRFAFGKDLIETKANIALVAPSHVATLATSNLPDNSLEFLKYIFVGGEAISPSQMKKFRETGRRLGVDYILNGYGMTETGSMSGLSEKTPKNDSDVTVFPVHNVQYRLVDSNNSIIEENNTRGVLQKKSPCQTAGYLDESKNEHLITPDGWINTDDIAERYDDGSYRIFGRNSDYFTVGNDSYAMFDIEEKVLDNPDVLEAEVIKFEVEGIERPAIVTVLKDDSLETKKNVLNYISRLNVDGIEFSIGTKFVDKFRTNPITAKRDYLSLTDDSYGYYSTDSEGNLFQTNILSSGVEKYQVEGRDIITSHSDNKVLRKKA